MSVTDVSAAKKPVGQPATSGARPDPGSAQFFGQPRFALALGVLSAGLATVPAAFRGGTPAPGIWLALTAASASLLGPLLAGISCVKPLTGALYAALTGLGLSALPLALFAAKLKEATHHRPLGAVTFALGALLLVLLAGAFALRAVSWAHTRRRAFTTALAVAALTGPALLLGALCSAKDARASVLDVGLALVTAFLLSRVPWPHTLIHWGSRLALPLWFLLVASGALVGLSDVGRAARLASPALFAPFSWFTRTPNVEARRAQSAGPRTRDTRDLARQEPRPPGPKPRACPEA